jgi:gamma-glutamyltranspeptidase/glutathione hydrolase
MLKTLESFDLAGREPWGAPYFELYAETAKLCWDERREHLGDPDFVKVPLAEMLSEQAALARAARIRQGPPRDAKPVPKDDGGHTASSIAVGADRSLCAVTATNGGGWGARVAIEGLGMPLAHGMSRFTWNDPASPNRAEPGKRMLHNMAPLVMLRGGKPLGLIGIVGGTRIPSATAQTVIGLLDFKKSPQAVLDGPRMHTEGNEPLEVTKNLPDPVFNELQLMGHKVKRVSGIGGPLNCGIISDDGKLTIAGTIKGGAAASM